MGNRCFCICFKKIIVFRLNTIIIDAVIIYCGYYHNCYVMIVFVVYYSDIDDML